MLHGDLGNIVLLMVLYCLQGVPLGLGLASLPYLLKKHLSYLEIATFSLAAYPYSLKFFWSPFVDSFYFASIGRRKSWIIPTQVLSGILMVSLSYYIEDMILSAEYINLLTFYIFALILLYATQDIAVDGWAVELLHAENKALASMCQSIGLTIGFFISFTCFLALNSKDFCNKYLFAVEQPAGLVSVSGYLWFWGYASIAIAVYLIFKHESPSKSDLTVKQIYLKVFSCVKSKNYQILIVVLLTRKLFTSFHDNALVLVLSEKGLNESELGLIALIILPIDISLSALVGYYLKKYNSHLSLYYKGFLLQLICCLYGLFLIDSFPSDKILTTSYYLMLFIGDILSSVASSFMFVSICAFFNIIVDQSIAGTILTFLNTVNNLGSSLPRYVIYRGISYFTIESTCHENYCTESRHGYFPIAYISLSLSMFYLFFLHKLLKAISHYSIPSWTLEHPVKTE